MPPHPVFDGPFFSALETMYQVRAVDSLSPAERKASSMTMTSTSGALYGPPRLQMLDVKASFIERLVSTCSNDYVFP